MLHRTTAAALSLLLIVSVFAPVAAAGPSVSAADATTGQSSVQSAPDPDERHGEDNATADPAPPDPEEDVLGWENGYWYNESISVTPSDGYNQTEVERILARSMARVERIRGLEFDETPNVNFVPRDEYSAWRSEAYRNAIYSDLSTKDRLHQNTKYEALFMVPEDESYFRDLIQNQGGSAAAFYTSQGIPALGVKQGEIALIVPEEGRASKFSESTLGHELVHRLQDTNLGVIDEFRGGPTEEAANVNTSLTEGEATLVGQRYAQKCGDEWDCIPEPERAAGSILDFENPALVMLSLGPYSETAELFAAADERGGPDAVTAIYDNPPVSTEQLLHPEKYPDDVPTEIEYTDTSSDEWSMQTFRNGVNYATFGEMGIFVMLYWPSLDERREVVSGMGVNYPFSGVTPPSRYDFTHPASSGWDGDKMFIYTRDDSAETNETAYVWETRWDSPEEAREFAEAYRTVLTDYARATAVGDGTGVYRAAEGSDYEDAFYVNVSGSSVTIVNAPTVEELPAVSASAPDVEVQQQTTTAPPTEPPTEPPTTAPSGETTAPETAATGTTASDGDDGGGSPGPTALAALVALAATLALLIRTRTDR
jgi:hypothetical protein